MNEIYLNDAKMLWRRDLWSCVMGASRSKVNDVAIMPGDNGLEIGVLRSMGVPVDGIHLIDENAAIVATHRRKIPDLGGTYGVTVARAFERMAQEGVRLDAAHLDYCSNASDRVAAELAHVGRSGVIRPGGAVAITILRGRERGQVQERFDAAHALDEIRAEHDDSYLPDPVGWHSELDGLEPTWRDLYRGAWAGRQLKNGLEGLGLNAVAIRHGAYRSGVRAHTMYWVIFTVTRTDDYAAYRAFPDRPMLGTFVTDGWVESDPNTPCWYQPRLRPQPLQPEQLRNHYEFWGQVNAAIPSGEIDQHMHRALEHSSYRVPYGDFVEMVRAGDVGQLGYIGPTVLCRIRDGLLGSDTEAAA